MKEFKPIAMRCNQQQYAEISQILLDNGCKCSLDGTFDERPYLVNNFSSDRNSINSTIYTLKYDYNRTVFETWNKDVFLEYCGIETKNEYKVGDYVIVKGYSKDYDGVPLKINNINANGYCFFDKTNYHDWQLNHNFHLRHIVRKAEPHEIPNKQNDKTEYIVGKWYKLPKHNWYLKHLNMTNNKWFYNERIMCNLNDYDFVIDWCDNNIEFTLLTDLSEIQQYLPNGHPDKIIAKPVETKSKYQIAAEEALKRFNDIQIGDEYMTMFGIKETATKLPEISASHSDHCFIDCGRGYLWQYNKPDKFGYKINKQNNIKIDADWEPLLPNPITTNKQLIKKIQPIQLIRKKKIVMDTKINPIKSINTNLKIKNQKLWT